MGRMAELAGALVLVACGSGQASQTPVDPNHRPPSAEIGELEIRASGLDRFTTCPPPGELGQNWIPTPFPWTPPPRDPNAPPPEIDQDFISRQQGRTNTEAAQDATHRDFRACYRRGLVHDPTQDGRLAVVLRVGPDGHVVKVEVYGACEIQPDSIACMEAAAARLRFPPPPSGSDTITIPATFTNREGARHVPSTYDDTYTASSYVTIESGRPAYHACEEQARKDLRPVQATATFTLDVAGDGHVLHTHIDPWTGDQPLLVCAARALERLVFAPPPGGKGTVIARLNFNPRQGSR
ncbi:MAG TPA: AgmX/PglI C-terminal domain-containing protein [Labilithrix sp.]|jgi:hypothetical protein